VTSPRRARFLVTVAGLAAVAAAVLLALLVAASLRGDPGRAVAYGLIAFGAAGLAAGSLVLARAGALAHSAPPRSRALCTRCILAALLAIVGVFAAAGVAILRTGSGAPVWGSTTAAVLLVPLVVLGTWQRASVRATARDAAPPAARRRRSGGGGESEPGATTGAR
jgi:hypothetical protein